MVSFTLHLSCGIGGVDATQLARDVVKTLKGEFASAELMPYRGDAIEIKVTTKPSIPELIEAWHYAPSKENRKALFAAIMKEPSFFFIWGGNRYAAATHPLGLSDSIVQVSSSHF